jgi:rhodanese-related sulfurtransferase
VGQAAAQKRSQNATVLLDLRDEGIERRRERLPG